MLKTVLLHIFVESVMHYFFRILWWLEGSKEQHLFELEIICNIINIFTLTFDKPNASLLNKSINFFQKKKQKRTDPKLLTGRVP